MKDCTYRPFLRFLMPADDNAGGGGGGGTPPASQQQSQNDPAKPEDRGYPQGVPVDDMSIEEKAAYHAYHSRKHENRVKAFGDWTPEKIAQVAAENERLRTAGQTESQREIEKAREEGRTEVRAELNRERATHALEKALQGRIPDASALLGLDVTKFVVAGSVDQAAIAAWVEDHSSETQVVKTKVDVGGGRRGDPAGGGEKSVAAGRDVYQERRNRGAQSKAQTS